MGKMLSGRLTLFHEAEADLAYEKRGTGKAAQDREGSWPRLQSVMTEVEAGNQPTTTG
ncbi:hypothetical protein [Synechococcus sp. M16CYN]|uniref:hypothetical protein n=1 Tax=Synechococcus sp. M16CYN TaxID=3103139 RepID=UPI0033404A7A